MKGTMKNITIKWLMLVVVVLTAVSFRSSGQELPDGISPADEQIRDSFTAMFSYWQGLLLPLTLVLVMAIKKRAGFIPDKYLPYVAPLVAGVLDFAAQKFGFWTGNPAIGVAMGGLATWFHQLVTQPKKEEGSPSPTPENVP